MQIMTPDGKLHMLLNDKDLETLLIDYLGFEGLQAIQEFNEKKVDNEYDKIYNKHTREIQSIEESYQRDLHDVCEALDDLTEELSKPRVLKSVLLKKVNQLKENIWRKL